MDRNEIFTCLLFLLSQPFKVPLADWQSVPKQMSSGDEGKNQVLLSVEVFFLYILKVYVLFLELIDETKCEMSEPGNEGSSYDMRCTGKTISALCEILSHNTCQSFQMTCQCVCLVLLMLSTLVLLGCVLSFEEVNSRTFASFQSSCTHSCDMHKVLKEATERYRTHHSSLFVRQEHTHSTSELTNPSAEKVRAAVAQNYQKNWRGKALQY